MALTDVADPGARERMAFLGESDTSDLQKHWDPEERT
jgi:hypothetical protein